MCIVPFTSDLFIHLNLKCVFRRRDTRYNRILFVCPAWSSPWLLGLFHTPPCDAISDTVRPTCTIEPFLFSASSFLCSFKPPYCYLLHYMRTLQCTILTPLRIFSLYRFELFSGQLLEGSYLHPNFPGSTSDVHKRTSRETWKHTPLWPVTSHPFFVLLPLQLLNTQWYTVIIIKLATPCILASIICDAKSADHLIGVFFYLMSHFSSAVFRCFALYF